MKIWVQRYSEDSYEQTPDFVKYCAEKEWSDYQTMDACYAKMRKAGLPNLKPGQRIRVDIFINPKASSSTDLLKNLIEKQGISTVLSMISELTKEDKK